MNLRMGSQVFVNVQIPLLWGNRAVVQDQQGRLSVIDLSGSVAKLEILGDRPAPGTEFVPTTDGFQILSEGEPIYGFNPEEKTLGMVDSRLPECQIGPSRIRVGSNEFSGCSVLGFGVGIAVTGSGVAMGAPLPAGLAELVV